MLKTILKVNNLYKKFSKNEKLSDFRKLKEFFYLDSNTRKLAKDEYWALQNISFSLKQGESLGILGLNGAGKSTLLKLINGSIVPDHGSVERFNSKISLMTALGSNLSSNLTGIENIKAIMGMTFANKAIEQKKIIKKIIDFSELEEFINQPIRTYSSGMRSRLAFALGIHVDANILLIDEVLSVGDIYFKDKCYRELAKLKRNGVSLIVVSHNPHAILISCERSLILQKGKLIKISKTIDTINKYENSIFDNTKLQNITLSKSGNLKFFLTQDDKIRSDIEAIKPVELNINFIPKNIIKDLDITVIIRDLAFEGGDVVFLNSTNDNFKLKTADKFNIRIIFNPNGLKPGRYSAEVKVREGRLHVLDEIQSHFFNVKSKKSFLHSVYYQNREWLS